MNVLQGRLADKIVVLKRLKSDRVLEVRIKRMQESNSGQGIGKARVCMPAQLWSNRGVDECVRGDAWINTV